MQETKGKRFSLFCDMEGLVSQVLQDDNHFLPSSLIGNMLFSIVVPGDLDKILNFFIELKNNRTAIGWEINVITLSGAETFSFFGGVFENRIGIAAATTKNGAQLLFTDLSRINNEQANVIRVLSKENEKLQSQQEEPTVSYYEELSRLNNELVNMQRELSKRNVELQKINAEKDKFFSIIAHDLKGPFNGFLGLTQIMAEQLPYLTMDEIHKISVTMRNSATNLFRLLENLLQWAIMQKGLIPFEPKQIVLLPNVDECITMILESAKNKGIKIIKNIPAEMEVFSDSNMLQTVIRNLVSNAVKFTPDGGSVTILAMERGNKTIEISVVDTGIGMSKKMIDDLFRLDVSTNRKGTAGEPSSGLGLLLCKEFIGKHGGEIWVESEEGKGSVFYFTIPKKS